MKPKIFVDGLVGTTGMMIHERLSQRDDHILLEIDPKLRKDPIEKKKIVNEADIIFLCLPDEAAKETVSLVDNDNSVIIDASTAHRSNKNWVYGLPEINSKVRASIKESKRISNPGCHATGFITLIAPLVDKGIINKDLDLTCNSLSGYSGAGKKVIEKYHPAYATKEFIEAPHHYGFSLMHKHLSEMKLRTGLSKSPNFLPMIGPFFKGMVVSVPLFINQLNGISSAKDLHNILSEHYMDEMFINIIPYGDSSELIDNNYFDPLACNNTNRLDIFVWGHDEHALLMARFDNLGKGASGAAIQNMNIVLGLDENTGLNI